MMRETMRVLKSVVPLLLATVLSWCLAQVDPWERVKLIEEGKKVQVKLHSGKTMNGKMEGWSTDGLSVRQGKGKIVPLAKPDIAQVAMVSGMSRKRKAAHAGLIGGGIMAGAVIGSCGGDMYCGIAAAGGATFVGGVAAGIAALFPPHKEVIYTAPAR